MDGAVSPAGPPCSHTPTCAGTRRGDCRGSRQEKSQEETKGRTEGDVGSDSLTKIEVRRETERAVIATC